MEHQDQLISGTDDFAAFEEAAFNYPQVHEAHYKSEKQWDELQQKMAAEPLAVPLFIKDPEGTLHLIPTFDWTNVKNLKGYAWVYLGKPLG